MAGHPIVRPWLSFGECGSGRPGVGAGSSVSTNARTGRSCAPNPSPTRRRGRSSPHLFALRTALRGAALVDLHAAGRGHEGNSGGTGNREPGHHSRDRGDHRPARARHDDPARPGRCCRDVTGWSEQRLGPVGEVALLRSSHQALLGRYDTARRTIAPVLDGSQPIRQADEADHETLASSPGAGVSRVFGSSGVRAPPNSGSTIMPAFELYRVNEGHARCSGPSHCCAVSKTSDHEKISKILSRSTA